jgi:hypothetical protein
MRIVILRSTGPQNNPKHFTPEFCDRLREDDDVAYNTDVLGEFSDPESGLANPLAARRSTRETPLELPAKDGAAYAAAVDVGENRLTLVIVEAYEAPREPDDDGDVELLAFRVALAFEARGGTPDTRWQEIAERCKRYDLGLASVDQYAASANAVLAQRCGLHLAVTPWGAANRLEAFTNVATLLHGGRLELPPLREFRSDLLAVKKRTTQSGVTIVLPTTRDGRHCDFAPALAAAIRTATSVYHADADEDFRDRFVEAWGESRWSSWGERNW